MNDSFDLVVIGAGPAGEKGAAQQPITIRESLSSNKSRSRAALP